MCRIDMRRSANASEFVYKSISRSLVLPPSTTNGEVATVATCIRFILFVNWLGMFLFCTNHRPLLAA